MEDQDAHFVTGFIKGRRLAGGTAPTAQHIDARLRMQEDFMLDARRRLPQQHITACVIAAAYKHLSSVDGKDSSSCTAPSGRCARAPSCRQRTVHEGLQVPHAKSGLADI